MAIEDNPQSRVKYGEELRRLREAAGLTQEELSQRAVMSRTHIAHIEAGRRRPDVDDARRLDQVLGTGGFFVRFLPTLDGRKVAEHFKEALEFEGKATVIKEYAPTLVPGILQTKAYAYEVLSSAYPRPSDEERDKLLATRLERARILDNFHSPEVCAMLDEAVLRRVIGETEVMCEQLRHIVELSESRRIRVHVLPFSAGAHPLQEGFLSLMWFAELPPIAYAEGVNSGRILELPSVVRDCQEIYDHVLGDALSHRKSLDLLRAVAEDYEHEAQRAQHP
ncbi:MULTISPECIES: helix-turn-helix domain-containing protein [Streptomyces phaeochromogenes group]|jgi:transcriptional regulator with XRE-family HTH domain|uniref:helix-turn-helix domain-containing protein n=1 Tax=Streptomyces phaeochromogenes group TaxID=2838332 RepID=UPI0006E1D055|nr:helix-turn-helix transcriptional regulator [Streptomyces phaeochromogenes]WTA04748.1 helix-turn-helix transcriptional regulator [Streptomyces phaeochromogenes]